MRNKLHCSLKLLVLAIGLILFNQAKAQYTFDWANEYFIGNNVFIQSISYDSGNNYFVTGEFKDSVDIDFSLDTTMLYSTPGSIKSTFIAKYTTNGVLVWSKVLTAVSTSVIPNSITVDAAGNSYIAGFFRASNSNATVYFSQTDSLTLGSDLSVIWILKLNSNGDFQWVKSIRIAGNDFPEIFNIKLDNSGNIYLSGNSHGTLNFGAPSNFTLSNFGINKGGFLAKYNSSGVFQWAKGFLHNNPYYSGALRFVTYGLNINSSNIFLTGFYDGNPDFNPGTGIDTLGFLPYLSLNSYILKLDLNGDFVSVNTLTGNLNVITSSILDTYGNLYITGGFNGTVDFDPGSAVNNLTSNGDRDIFIAKYTSAGGLLWAKNVGGSNFDMANNLVLDYNGNVAIVGNFEDTVDFNPGTGLNEHTSNGSNDCFLLFLDANGNYNTSYTWGGNNSDVFQLMTKDNNNNLIIGGYHYSNDMAYTGFGQVNQGGTNYAPFILKISAPNTTSIQDETNITTVIYPNPATTQFTIANAEIGTRVSVFDITGKVMFTETVNASTHNISTKDLVSGIYFVQLENNGQISQKKLVVNK